MVDLVLNWNKGKVKPCKFANLTTPEAACVDHPDIVVLFIWRYVFYPPLPISLKAIWGIDTLWNFHQLVVL